MQPPTDHAFSHPPPPAGPTAEADQDAVERRKARQRESMRTAQKARLEKMRREREAHQIEEGARFNRRDILTPEEYTLRRTEELSRSIMRIRNQKKMLFHFFETVENLPHEESKAQVKKAIEIVPILNELMKIDTKARQDRLSRRANGAARGSDNDDDPKAAEKRLRKRQNDKRFHNNKERKKFGFPPLATPHGERRGRGRGATSERGVKKPTATPRGLKRPRRGAHATFVDEDDKRTVESVYARALAVLRAATWKPASVAPRPVKEAPPLAPATTPPRIDETALEVVERMTTDA